MNVWTKRRPTEDSCRRRRSKLSSRQVDFCGVLSVVLDVTMIVPRARQLTTFLGCRTHSVFNPQRPLVMVVMPMPDPIFDCYATALYSISGGGRRSRRAGETDEYRRRYGGVSGNSNNTTDSNNHNRRRNNGRSPSPPTPQPGQPGREYHRSCVPIDAEVFVVKKEDQRTGRETRGIVSRHLTRSEYHPRGIKVMLADGVVGRVIRIVD